MTHRSRVCAVLFDTDAALFEATTRFWSSALGRNLEATSDKRYRALRGDDLDFLVQRIDAGVGRVHIDVETDDVAAEVARLEGLGAKRIDEIDSWVVLEDPGGHLFCVVAAHSRAWPHGAVEWPS